MVNRLWRQWRLIAVAGLLAAWLVAPRLPPMVLLPVSAVGLGVLGALLWWAGGWLHRTIGYLGPILGLLALGGGMVIVGRDWPAERAIDLPCRRNWGWLPSYLLRSSPTESLSFELADTRVKICWGSPRLRGRRMIGGPAVPFGQLWRTGANEPTTIVSTGPITVAGIPLDSGKASLYSIPGPETWELILNRSTRQWGIESEYAGGVREAEIGRAVVTASAGGPTEALTFAVEPGPDPSQVVVVLAWGSVLVRFPVAAAGR